MGATLEPMVGSTEVQLRQRHTAGPLISTSTRPWTVDSTSLVFIGGKGGLLC
jgi:hypothetical protein